MSSENDSTLQLINLLRNGILDPFKIPNLLEMTTIGSKNSGKFCFTPEDWRLIMPLVVCDKSSIRDSACNLLIISKERLGVPLVTEFLDQFSDKILSAGQESSISVYTLFVLFLMSKKMMDQAIIYINKGLNELLTFIFEHGSANICYDIRTVLKGYISHNVDCEEAFVAAFFRNAYKNESVDYQFKVLDSLSLFVQEIPTLFEKVKKFTEFATLTLRKILLEEEDELIVSVTVTILNRRLYDGKEILFLLFGKENLIEILMKLLEKRNMRHVSYSDYLIFFCRLVSKVGVELCKQTEIFKICQEADKSKLLMSDSFVANCYLELLSSPSIFFYITTNEQKDLYLDIVKVVARCLDPAQIVERTQILELYSRVFVQHHPPKNSEHYEKFMELSFRKRQFLLDTSQVFLKNIIDTTFSTNFNDYRYVGMKLIFNILHHKWGVTALKSNAGLVDHITCELNHADKNCLTMQKNIIEFIMGLPHRNEFSLEDIEKLKMFLKGTLHGITANPDVSTAI